MSDEPQNQNALNQGRAFPWHELYTPNLAASMEFYQNALGLGTESMEMGEYGAYHMLTHGGAAVAGLVDISVPEHAGTPPHWGVYLYVEDVDEALSKVAEFGGSVKVPAMDIPTVGRMAQIADPQGATIWVFRPGM
jgi:predicted enzyme related to lactoylglutathione lyase